LPTTPSSPHEEAIAHLESLASGTWVGLDVVMVAFGVKRRQAYQLAKEEGWFGVGRPVQWKFDDVARTHRRLTEEKAHA